MKTQQKETKVRDVLKCDRCQKVIESVSLYNEDGRCGFSFGGSMRFGEEFLKTKWFAERDLIIANGRHYHDDCFVEEYVSNK